MTGSYLGDAIEALEYDIESKKGVIEGNLQWINIYTEEIVERIQKIEKYRKDTKNLIEYIKKLEKIVEGLRNEYKT